MRQQMTIGKRFGLTGGALAMLTVLLGAVSLIGLASIHKRVKRLSDDALEGVSVSARVESALLEMRGDILKHIGANGEAQMNALEANIAKLKKEMNRDLTQQEQTAVSNEERQLVRNTKQSLERYFSLYDEIRLVSRAQQREEAYRKYADATAIATAAKEAARAETDFNRQLGKTATAEAESTYSSVRWTVLLVMLTAIFGGGAALVVSVRGTNRTLLSAVHELSQGADQVAAAAAQVSSSSQQLAQGSSEQAASLEETSASAREIESMAARNTENSGRAAGLVDESNKASEGTNQALEQMLAAMAEINASSNKVSKIIQTIDEIAFQTNILALNAAVEAARAGEAGLGFAVVADEVRNLAQRCAQAAKDTAGLIEESIQRSNEGKVKVDQVAQGIQAITGRSSEVKILIDEVNLSSQEQGKGIEQVAQAVSQMERVTQSTAASAEQAASAAEELNAQSEAVKGVVAQLSALVGASAKAA